MIEAYKITVSLSILHREGHSIALLKNLLNKSQYLQDDPVSKRIR